MVKLSYTAITARARCGSVVLKVNLDVYHPSYSPRGDRFGSRSARLTLNFWAAMLSADPRANEEGYDRKAFGINARPLCGSPSTVTAPIADKPKGEIMAITINACNVLSTALVIHTR